MIQLTMVSFLLLQIPLIGLLLTLNQLMCSMSVKMIGKPYPMNPPTPLIYKMLIALPTTLIICGYIAINYEILQNVQLT